MSAASLAMVLVAGMMTGIGFLPCFACLQFVAVPFSAATFVVGVIGLATDRDERGRACGLPMHLAAVVGGRQSARGGGHWRKKSCARALEGQGRGQLSQVFSFESSARP